ncbi:hypothetical protein VTK56DRAFT_6644 [Thermocarpiscus australiensis]
MEDTVRISAERFREIYEDSFNVWRGFYERATKLGDSRLPAAFLSIQRAFSQHPSFPLDLHLKQTKYALYATGSSTWGATQTDAGTDCVLPSFHQQRQIGVALRTPYRYRLPRQENVNSIWALGLCETTRAILLSSPWPGHIFCQLGGPKSCPRVPHSSIRVARQ